MILKKNTFYAHTHRIFWLFHEFTTKQQGEDRFVFLCKKTKKKKRQRHLRVDTQRITIFFPTF